MVSVVPSASQHLSSCKDSEQTVLKDFRGAPSSLGHSSFFRTLQGVQVLFGTVLCPSKHPSLFPLTRPGISLPSTDRLKRRLPTDHSTLLLHLCSTSNSTKKMPPLTTEDQFKFLIACIKHSTAGKVRTVLPCLDSDQLPCANPNTLTD